MADIFGIFGDPARSGPGKSTKSKRSWDEIGPRFSNKNLTFDVTAVQESQDTTAMTGSAYWAATLAATDEQDTATFTGQVNVAGSFNATDPADTFDLTGSLIASGSLSGTDAPDTLEFTGGSTITGTLTATEPADAGTMTAVMVALGVMGDSLGFDSTGALFDSGAVTWDTVGSTLVEAPDTAAMEGAVSDGGFTGTLAGAEEPDTFTASGSIPVVETPRSRGGGGLVTYWTPEPIEGTLAAKEAPDTVEMAGEVESPVVQGTLAATERADSVLAFGNVSTKGALRIVETPDTVSINAKTGLRPDWARYDEDLLMLAA